MTTMYESGSPYIMTGADIVRMGEPAEMLVGGKNYNTALISPPLLSSLCSTRAV